MLFRNKIDLREEKMQVLVTLVELGVPFFYLSEQVRNNIRPLVLQGQISGAFELDFEMNGSKYRPTRAYWEAYPLWHSDHPFWYEAPFYFDTL
jgi:hypothetical protein